MTRFLVVMVDPTDNSTSAHAVRAATPATAIIQHKWITEIYKDSWVQNNIFAENHEKMTIDNVWNKLGWITSCTNLDSEIMKDLNGGDSNSSYSHADSSSGN